MMDTAGEENAKGWGRKGVLSNMASWISFLDGPAGGISAFSVF